jgi:hypothetical protein
MNLLSIIGKRQHPGMRSAAVVWAVCAIRQRSGERN